MALYNNLRFFLFLCSLLTPLHLARPDPESSPRSEPVSSPSPGPASVSSASLGPAPVITPSSGPSPTSGSAPGPTPLPPSPFSGSAPAQSPSWGSTLGPTSSSGPAPGTSPSLGAAPGPTLSSESAPGPSPNSGLASELTPSSGPTPATADAPIESDGPIEFDFSPTLAPSVDVDPKVQEICDSTDHASLCLATVVPLLNGKTDASSVLNAAIRAGENVSRQGLFLAQKLAGDPELPPELVSALDDCKRSYKTAVDNYDNAIDAFPEHDISTMNSMLSAAITNVGDCEDAFSKMGEDSPFSSIAVRLTNMTSNCLSIVSLLD